METTQTTGNDLTINVNGVTLCYDDFGEGTMPIIFIHGFPLNKSSWQPQMEFLKKNHRVIAYDIRGFGNSTVGKEKQSISLFADDLVKLMDALEIKKAIVCGLSMGGYILLNALNRYPEKFEVIILSDTQCIADTPVGKEKRYKTIQQINEDGLNNFVEAFLKNIFCEESLTDKKEVVEKIQNIILSTQPEIITGTLNALAQREEMCSSLDKISVPTLIICGKEDKVTPLAQSDFMLSKIKNSILHTIEKAGHLSNLEQPNEFIKQVENFISDLVKDAESS